MARMAMRSSHAHILPLLALAFVSWIVLLGGLSAVQNQCAASLGDSTSLSNNRACSSQYRYPWWVTWLAFAVFVGCAAMVLIGHLERSRVALVGMLAFLSALLVIQTDAFLSAHDGANGNDRITTTFVGFLLTTIFSLGLMLSLGTAHAGDVDGNAPVRTGHTTTTSKV